MRYCLKPNDKNIEFIHTKDCGVWRQYGMWHDTEKVIQFMPSAKWSTVLCVLSDSIWGCKPLYSWVIYRGASLVVTFDRDIGYHCQTGDKDALEKWYKQYRDVGKVIGRRT